MDPDLNSSQDAVSEIEVVAEVSEAKDEVVCFMDNHTRDIKTNLFVNLGATRTLRENLGFVMKVPLVASCWYRIGRCNGTVELT